MGLPGIEAGIELEATERSPAAGWVLRPLIGTTRSADLRVSSSRTPISHKTHYQRTADHPEAVERKRWPDGQCPDGQSRHDERRDEHCPNVEMPAPPSGARGLLQGFWGGGNSHDEQGSRWCRAVQWRGGDHLTVTSKAATALADESTPCSSGNWHVVLSLLWVICHLKEARGVSLRPSVLASLGVCPHPLQMIGLTNLECGHRSWFPPGLAAGFF